jgi:hypothetical protein
VRVSCARSPRRAADAGGSGQSARPGTWQQRQVTDPHLELSMPEARCCWRASWDRRLLPARHGWLRRNAVSPQSVRLKGAPGAPLWIGCSSANRALAGRLPWDGILAVPKVIGAGCLALSLVRRVRAARPSGRFPAHLPGLRVHGGARRNAQRCGNRGYLAALDRAARNQLGPLGAAS